MEKPCRLSAFIIPVEKREKNGGKILTKIDEKIHNTIHLEFLETFSDKSIQRFPDFSGRFRNHVAVVQRNYPEKIT